MNTLMPNMNALPPDINKSIPLINHIIPDDDLVSFKIFYLKNVFRNL